MNVVYHIESARALYALNFFYGEFSWVLGVMMTDQWRFWFVVIKNVKFSDGHDVVYQCLIFTVHTAQQFDRSVLLWNIYSGGLTFLMLGDHSLNACKGGKILNDWHYWFRAWVYFFCCYLFVSFFICFFLTLCTLNPLSCNNMAEWMWRNQKPSGFMTRIIDKG